MDFDLDELLKEIIYRLIELEGRVLILEDKFEAKISHRPARQEAKEFLMKLLVDNPTGLPAGKIQAKAISAGISLMTLRRAKKELGIICRKKGSTWYWVWPKSRQ